MNKLQKQCHLGSFVPKYQFATCKKPCSGLKLLIPVELTLCEHLDQSIFGTAILAMLPWKWPQMGQV